MTEITYDFKNIFDAFILFMAFLWTLAYLNQILQFITFAYNKNHAKIYVGNMILPSLFWTIYILFCRQ